MNAERESYWCKTINECNDSGMSVADWCGEHGIRKDLYYKWQRRLIRSGAITSTKHTNQRTWRTQESQKEEAGFVEISPQMSDTQREEDSGITISKNGYSISLTNGFSKDALLRVLEVVSHA